MAFKPSLRAHNKVKDIPLDIRPVMNLMVVLIPILLYSAEFVKLSIRELNLPPASAEQPGEQGSREDGPKEKEKKFGLTLIVAKNGFFLGNKSGYLSEASGNREAPSITMNTEGKYEFKQLQQKLLEIKQRVKGQGFADEKSIIISAEADIEYKHIIKVIDFVTTYEDSSGVQQELFPQINIGQII